VTIGPRARRAAFILYAVVLFLGTHWPKLVVEGAGRPDLFVHVAAFMLWTIALGLTGWLGSPLRLVPRLWIGAVAIAYAAVDESLQAIPALSRHAGFDDFAANVVGVLLGVGSLFVAGRAGWLRWFSDPSADLDAPRDRTAPSR